MAENKYIEKITYRPTAANEYQKAMMHRVDEFAEKSKSSIFNSFTENVVIKGLSTILDLKVKVDDMLGENKNKVYDVLEKVLLFGL